MAAVQLHASTARVIHLPRPRPSIPISEDGATQVLAKLERMFASGKVKNFLCQRLIAVSAYWYEHPHGPAKAPRHGDRVVNGWIDFGANSLNVAGVVRCMVKEARTIIEKGQKAPAAILARELEHCLSGNVMGGNGNYYHHYPHHDGYLHFGAQAIHAREFTEEFTRLAELALITTER